MPLTLPDGRTFTVIFDRADGPPIEAQQVLPLSAPSDDHNYTVVIRLLTVEESKSNMLMKPERVVIWLFISP